MQKQRMYKRKSSGWRNANTRITESVSNDILTLCERLELNLGDDESPPFFHGYLLDNYLSKYCDESLVSSDDRKSAAILKWLTQEDRNRATNYSFIFRDPGFNILPRVTWRSFIKFCRRLIFQILGPLHDSVVLGSFSGGASTSRRRTNSFPAMKFCGEADITEEARDILYVLYNEAPLLRQYSSFTSLRDVPGAILFTVPKKSDIDRCACKEPDINMFLQKGVGSHIRRRLRKFGIDLNDQSHNRELAQVGSSTGSLATLDLSSASDSITIECVRALLPDDWFSYLNCIRSQSVSVNGTWVVTEMFSSMGNGFTFELESLIFYALSRATAYFTNCPGIISIYGDDVICPSAVYEPLSFVFKEFGFLINPDKSFSTGPFRESCGGHYYNGHDITPFYLKRKPTHLTDLIRVLNQFRKWIIDSDLYRQLYYTNAYDLWRSLANHVPSNLWGGSDYELDTQLVSAGRGVKRLCRIQSPRSEPEMGRYLVWQNTNWNRSSLPKTEIGYATDTNQMCRARAATSGALRWNQLFSEECN